MVHHVTHHEFQITVQWGPRYEPLSAVADRVDATLRRLSVAIPDTEGWLGMDARSETFVPATDKSRLESLLEAGSGRYELGEWASGELTQALFVTARTDQIALSLQLNAVEMAPGVGPENFAQVLIPAPIDMRTAGESRLRAILVALAESFDPRWGRVGSVRNGIERPDRAALLQGVPDVGWMSYISRELGAVPRVSAPHRVEELPGMGVVVVARPQPWDFDDPSHRESLASVRADLDALGVLKAEPALDCTGLTV